MSRSYGWAPPGETPIIERPAKGRRISLTGAIAKDGTRALRKIDGYMNGEKFVDFLRNELGPRLKIGDIVVMDNSRIHKVKGVAEVLAERGATALYLPAYSPEWNPIEMTWAWIKKRLRDAPPRKLPDLRTRIDDLWMAVSAPFCAGWVRHCGYTST